MSKKPNPIESYGSMMSALQAENSAALIPVEADAPPSPAPAKMLEIHPSVPPYAPEAKRRPGRPISATSKKQDGRYVQTSILIMETTRDAVKIALLRGGSKQDTSDLIQSLLENWLKTHQ